MYAVDKLTSERLRKIQPRQNVNEYWGHSDLIIIDLVGWCILILCRVGKMNV